MHGFERLKEKFLHEEKIVDLVVGPDAYRDLPNLLKEVEFGNDAVNVLLSKDETYADINPQEIQFKWHFLLLYQLHVVVITCAHFVLYLLQEVEREVEIQRGILAEIKELEENGYKKRDNTFRAECRQLFVVWWWS